MKKVGLVLGGGSARGIAHIGVFKVLQEYHIPIAAIAATSVGSMMGAFLAGGLSVEVMAEGAKRIGWGRLLKLTMPIRGAFSSEAIERFVVRNMGDKTFAELSIPLQIVASDLKLGKPYIFSKGRVAFAVAASASIPGMFQPVSFEGKQLVDGMVTNNLPVDVVRAMGAEYVIAIDVIPRVNLTEDLRDVIHVFERMLDVFVIRQSEISAEQADVVILPVRENISPLALQAGAKLMRLGEEAARIAMPEIQKALGLA